MGDGAITDLKTSESSVAREKLKKTKILSAPEEEHSRVLGTELEKALRPNCFLRGPVFIHAWNAKAKPKMTVEEIVMVHGEESAMSNSLDCISKLNSRPVS